MATHRYLEISTAAVTREVMGKLTRGEIEGISTYPSREGAFVMVPSEMAGEGELRERLQREEPGLCALLVHAVEQDCQAVRLDADGDGVPEGLPSHDW
jgi:hypothetical protein